MTIDPRHNRLAQNVVTEAHRHTLDENLRCEPGEVLRLYAGATAQLQPLVGLDACRRILRDPSGGLVSVETQLHCESSHNHDASYAVRYGSSRPWNPVAAVPILGGIVGAVLNAVAPERQYVQYESRQLDADPRDAQVKLMGPSVRIYEDGESILVDKLGASHRVELKHPGPQDR